MQTYGNAGCDAKQDGTSESVWCLVFQKQIQTQKKKDKKQTFLPCHMGTINKLNIQAENGHEDKGGCRAGKQFFSNPVKQEQRNNACK